MSNDLDFQVTKQTVAAIRRRVNDNYTATKSGIAVSRVAQEMCGDEKYAPCISFVVENFLKGEIEPRQGLGLLPAGVTEVVRSTTRAAVEVDEEFLLKTETFCSEQLKSKHMTGKELFMRSIRERISDIEEEPKFRAALQLLSEAGKLSEKNNTYRNVKAA